MTPFLKAISKALSAELEIGFSDEMKELILDEIIRTIPSENSTSTQLIGINTPASVLDTLHLEFDDILRRFVLQ